MGDVVEVDGKVLLALCDATAVSDDTPARVEGAGMDYAVFRFENAYYVTQDLCTHGPGSLGEGYIEGCEVECPFHQGRFDFRTGAPTLAPCTDSLRIWTAFVVNGKICIDPTEQRVSG